MADTPHLSIEEEQAASLAPKSYGELGDLAVELNSREKLAREDAFEAFLEWTANHNIELWPHQEEALMGLMLGDHVILGTPTGTGKTLVALGMHFMALAMGETSYYTAPIKALVSEKFFALVDLFGREFVGMLTGDVQINPEAPIICCTAEILANRALSDGPDADIASVAADEFHYFADPDRGWAWQVPLLALHNTQFLLMSATLGDVTDIEGLLTRQTDRTCDLVLDAERPVPLTFEYAMTPLEATAELTLRDGAGPIYVVHFSQDAALESAQNLASYGITTKEERKAIAEELKGTRFTTAFGKTLKRLLAAGVGVHHAGMLPRYRRCVERLAQAGLLPIICGTDTLGVGINVPIHTVVFTQLSKFDGHRTRRLRSREFLQIAGRAGRAGFDTEGLVIAEAPEHDIENFKAMQKAGDDPKKQRKIKKKRPPEGFVGWNEETFKKLVDSAPEKLTPRMKVTHSMVLSVTAQGGDARAKVAKLIDDSLQTEAQKLDLHTRAAEIFATLIDAGVIVEAVASNGTVSDALTMALPPDFALDQPLSPFLLAAVELLDPESETYDLDLISMAEATLEDPRQILRAQVRQARAAAIAEMKMAGIDYDERMERVQEVTYEQPLTELLDPAFADYCLAVPWARDFSLRPKSILRDMLVTASDFKSYIQRLGIARYEGILLRYLSDAFRVLDRTIPAEKRTDRLDEIVAWLGLMVRSVDSSLVDEWESAGSEADLTALPPEAANAVVKDRRGLTLLVRNALFRRVLLAAQQDAAALGALDADWGFNERVWTQVLERYYDQHETVLIDGDARSSAFLEIDESDEKTAHVWHVRQTFNDSDGDRDFSIWGDVDLDATQESDGVVFKSYRAGFYEDQVA